MAFLKVALALLMVLGLVNALPTGAPPEACEDLVPGHGFPGQTSESPYVAIPDTTTVQAGQTVSITLQPLDGSTTFQGFMILAQIEGSESFDGIGTFVLASNGIIGSCLGETDNYVTHSDTSNKGSVTVVWRAPADFSGSVVFRTTFAQNLYTYWIATTSVAVTVRA